MQWCGTGVNEIILGIVYSTWMSNSEHTITGTETPSLIEWNNRDENPKLTIKIARLEYKE